MKICTAPSLQASVVGSWEAGYWNKLRLSLVTSTGEEIDLDFCLNTMWPSKKYRPILDTLQQKWFSSWLVDIPWYSHWCQKTKGLNYPSTIDLESKQKMAMPSVLCCIGRQSAHSTLGVQSFAIACLGIALNILRISYNHTYIKHYITSWRKNTSRW